MWISDVQNFLKLKKYEVAMGKKLAPATINQVGKHSLQDVPDLHPIPIYEVYTLSLNRV